MTVPGLDGIYIGPSDLSASLEREPRFDPEDPLVLSAIERILQRCRSAGLVPGIHTGSLAYAWRMIDKGFRLVTVGSDSRFMAAGAAATVAAMRAEDAASVGSATY